MESQLKSGQESELLKKYYEKLNCYEEANTFFTKCVVECLKSNFKMFPSKTFTKDKLPVYFFPFSIGELDPSGVLMDLYNPIISGEL